MSERNRNIDEEVERKRLIIWLLSIVLVISLVLNAILLFGFFQATDEGTGITIEQYDAPITIYNNITINSNGLLNETIIEETTEYNEPFQPY